MLAAGLGGVAQRTFQRKDLLFNFLHLCSGHFNLSQLLSRDFAKSEDSAQLLRKVLSNEIPVVDKGFQNTIVTPSYGAGWV
ncbi:hypothetical protein SAMN04487972_1036 [Paracoccus halophilus]|uniref:Uncharacterized protein n=1 Tax=Paracoccus halophilus TaxID=376733 RepID=A0A1I0SV71_9RHOB|nr:hypothetical protein SAMN04487972_1036 [Paracoccus halophilus]